jgi:hypothetical protein
VPSFLFSDPLKFGHKSFRWRIQLSLRRVSIFESIDKSRPLSVAADRSVAAAADRSVAAAADRSVVPELDTFASSTSPLISLSPLQTAEPAMERMICARRRRRPSLGFAIER